MKRTHFLRVYNKRMLCEHDCVMFRGRIAWHSFLENSFAEFFGEVQVKINIKISSCASAKDKIVWFHQNKWGNITHWYQ